MVLLTSNNTRELTEALKRRCLYLWLDYPSSEHELEIVRLHAPELPEKVAQRLVEVVQMVRELDLKKPPSIAESIDWARALLLLGADDIDADVFQLDALDHRQAPHRPRHRGRAGRRAARGGRDLSLPAGVVAFAEELRAEGLAVGTSELLDAFGALGEVSWTEESAFRETLAATLAKSPEDRRVFDLVFERFFFRAAEAAAMEQGVREGPAGAGSEDEDGITGGEQIDYDNLREQLLQAIRDGDESAMRDLARLAIVAFGRRGEGSGVLGVDVQRIRRALGLRSEPGGPVRETEGELPPPPLTRDQIRRFEQLLRRELERAQIERTQSLPPSRPLNELDRALPSGPLQDLAAVHRVVAQLKRRLATQGHETRGRSATRTSTCAGRCARRCRPVACRSSSSTARGGRSARSCTCCATSPPRSPARRCSS